MCLSFQSFRLLKPQSSPPCAFRPFQKKKKFCPRRRTVAHWLVPLARTAYNVVDVEHCRRRSRRATATVAGPHAGQVVPAKVAGRPAGARSESSCHYVSSTRRDEGGPRRPWMGAPHCTCRPSRLVARAAALSVSSASTWATARFITEMPSDHNALYSC